MRALSSWGVPLRRHPHPNPLPQAGEGAHRPRRPQPAPVRSARDTISGGNAVARRGPICDAL
ncbi:hypothetical protein C7G41_35840 [Bradyrhizobium sp. MOS002]|nr:hypothetical protein C7G41_35840 [Bradyrhizobium sp. MOS002]